MVAMTDKTSRPYKTFIVIQDELHCNFVLDHPPRHDRSDHRPVRFGLGIFS